ncbi:hypothetical protein ABMC89_18965, partial [Sulfitobacter sp. HNIBRBA3233]|uniref:hypothetical protein n=1 Tax=Sulfitobacter marinivivus TaxID=3158558 RepID=UPI0032DF1903
SEELMEAYDLALEEYEAGATDPEADAADLIAALSLETDVDASTYEDDPADDTVDIYEAV